MQARLSEAIIRREGNKFTVFFRNKTMLPIEIGDGDTLEISRHITFTLFDILYAAITGKELNAPGEDGFNAYGENE